MSLNVYLETTVDAGGPEPHRVEFYSANVTHDLNRMADEAGIYEPLWRPEQVGITQAAQLIEHLQFGLAVLGDDPARFEKLNPKNGWGSYSGFVEFVEGYLVACEKWPKATVRASR